MEDHERDTSHRAGDAGVLKLDFVSNGKNDYLPGPFCGHSRVVHKVEAEGCFGFDTWVCEDCGLRFIPVTWSKAMHKQTLWGKIVHWFGYHRWYAPNLGTPMRDPVVRYCRDCPATKKA